MSAGAGAQSPHTTDIDAYVHRALADWSVPGAALAIVKDGKIVLARGYGVLQLSRPELVTENTLFGIGSVTKTFTTATVARLVDAGRLSWDDKVIDRLPGFQLSDPWISEHVTLRDVLTHRVGLDEIENNLPWLLGALPRKEYVARLRLIPVRYAFRDSFNYSNGMVDTLGQLIEAVTGQSWEQQVDANVFRPLGMTRTVSGRDKLVSAQNLAPSWTGRAPDDAVPGLAGLLPGITDVAAPHGPDRSGKMIVYPWHHEQMNAPAGGVTSSAHDMALFMLAHLSGRSASGTVFLKPETLNEMFSTQALHRATVHMAADNDTAGRVEDVGFGIGWFIQKYAGRKMLEHGGGQIGYSSEIALIPSANLGVCVLLNEHYFDEHSFTARPLATALMYRLLDREMNLEPLDWSRRFLERTRARKAAAEEKIARYLAKADGRPNLSRPDLKQYAGLYRHPANGELRLIADRDGLGFAFTPLITGRLVQESENIFRLQFDNEHYHTRAFALVLPARTEAKVDSLTLKVALAGDDEFYPIDWTYRLSRTSQ